MVHFSSELLSWEPTKSHQICSLTTHPPSWVVFEALRGFLNGTIFPIHLFGSPLEGLVVFPGGLNDGKMKMQKKGNSKGPDEKTGSKTDVLNIRWKKLHIQKTQGCVSPPKNKSEY